MNLDLYHRLVAGETAGFSLSPRALWKLDGPDAERYLNGQVTCDVTRLADGQTSYAAVCTAKGRMEGDLTIARRGDTFYLDAVAELRDALGARLDKFLIADDATLEDISDQWHLRYVFGTTAPAVPDSGFVVTSTRYGLAGHDIWCPALEDAPALNAVDAAMVETLRIEHAIPLWGAELTANSLPPEAGPWMLAAISYTKGCYVGQETIARLKSVGHVNKTLVFLRAPTAGFPARGAKLFHAEREVGHVTSSTFSPRLDCGVALAYVHRQHAAEGTELAAENLKLTIAPSLAKPAVS
jgi:folate-binding protein YgfZ